MRTALVTGANSGIGFAVVERFIEEGYRVLALVREDYGNLKDLDTDSRLCVLKGDLSDIGTVSRLASDNKLDEVDILVNNAGMYIFREEFESILAEEIEQVLRVNLIAPLLLCQVIAPRMAERGWGRIINVSSVSV
ncbi:uncharacterized protein METZ01_LOCUS488888, partial [marine metagenome]